MKPLKKLLLLILFFSGLASLQAQTLIIGRPAVVGFTEEFSPEKWVFDKPENFVGSFETGNAPDEITFLGSDVIRGPVSGGATATLSVEFIFSGFLTFDWSVIHYDYCCDHVRFYILDQHNQTVYDSGPFGFDSPQPSYANGTFEHEMLPGYTFYIESYTSDNGVGPIDITLSNWKFDGGGTIIHQRVRNPVSLGSPAIGAINQPTNTTLTWMPVQGAVAYWLQVSTKPTFNTFLTCPP